MQLIPTLFFDTETSDLINFKARDTDPSQPWVVQLAAILSTEERIISSMNMTIQSKGLPMSKGAQETHGISVEFADNYGHEPEDAFNIFVTLCNKADLLVAHNKSFDFRLIAIMAKRINSKPNNLNYEVLPVLDNIKEIPSVCTMMSTTKLCQLPYPSGKAGNKWPKLTELHMFLFGEEFDGAHDALADVMATRRCYYELLRRGVL